MFSMELITIYDKGSSEMNLRANNITDQIKNNNNLKHFCTFSSLIFENYNINKFRCQ